MKKLTSSQKLHLGQCISFWIPKEEHRNWKENANSKGLKLGTLARLLMKGYYEGSIELHL